MSALKIGQLNTKVIHHLTAHHIIPPILTNTNITGKVHDLIQVPIKEQNTIY